MICEATVKKYSSEDISLIENYNKAINDDTQTWDLHHRLELHPDCSVRFTRNSLIKLDLYYNRPASELIFLPHTEHRSKHNKGKHRDAVTKAKIAESMKGMKFLEEHKQKISEALKGKKRAPFTEEHRAKMAESARKRWAMRNGGKECLVGF